MGSHQAFGVSLVDGNGFLHHHVQSAFQRRNPHGRVRIMRGRNNHGVHNTGSQQFDGV